MASNKSLPGIIAGIIGGIVFVGFYVILSLPIIVSAISAIAAFGISLVFFRPNGAAKAEQMPDTSIAVREVIANGNAQAAEMAKIARSLPAGNCRKILESLADLTRKIVEDVRQDPPDHKVAGKFLDYYADTTIRIASIYRDLAAKGIDGPEFRQMTAKIENNFSVLERAFKQHLVQLQDNNFMDLDAEISVLDSTLKMEGLGGNANASSPANLSSIDTDTSGKYKPQSI